MGRYEDIMYAQGEDATELLAMIDEKGPEAAIDQIASDSHMGGHDTRDEQPHGSSDHFHHEDGYTLSWNNRLGYVGLVFDTLHSRS